MNAIEGIARETKEYFDAILEHIPAGVAIFEGQEFRYAHINQYLADINGLSIAEHLGKTLAQVLPDAARHIVPRLQKVLETGQSAPSVEFGTRLPKNPDETRYFLDRFFPILGSDGKPRAVGAVVVDITERRQIERERFQQLTHAGRVNTMGELTASLAHEIRQPLTAILSNAQAAVRFLSARRPDLEELRQILADIIKDDRRAGEIIKRLQAMLGKGAPTEAQVLNLNQVVADVLPLVRSDAIIRGVRTALDLDSRLPFVRCDKVQLQQVILNLLVNGVEAMKDCRPDDGMLMVRTARHGPENAIVSIQDCGIGVTEENLEQVFTPFYTTKPNGMGMGLSIARSIVELYNGRMWATKNSDRGATFSFTLPTANTGET